MKSSRIPPAAPTSVPWKKAAARLPPIPFEDWRYRYIEGIGQEVIIEFVDTCMCGDYHMTMDRSEKDALLHTPERRLDPVRADGHGEQGGPVHRRQAWRRLGAGPFSTDLQTKEFDRLEQFAKLPSRLPVKFKDLEEIVSHKISVNLMPFDVRTDFVQVTDDTVLVPITIQIKNRDITFVNKDGVERGTVNIFGRVTTLTGNVAQTFEDTVQVGHAGGTAAHRRRISRCTGRLCRCGPDRYRLDVVVKDVNGDRTGTWSSGIIVPEYTR